MKKNESKGRYKKYRKSLVFDQTPLGPPTDFGLFFGEKIDPQFFFGKLIYNGPLLMSETDVRYFLFLLTIICSSQEEASRVKKQHQKFNIQSYFNNCRSDIGTPDQV